MGLAYMTSQELLIYLKQNYGYCKPFLFSRLSRYFTWIPDRELYRLLGSLVVSKLVLAYDANVFYIPDPYGILHLSDLSVIKVQYVQDQEDVFGCVVGQSFLYDLGLDNLKLYEKSIISNKVVTPSKLVLGDHTLIKLYSSPFDVSKSNYKLLQVLVSMSLDASLMRLPLVLGKRLTDYLQNIKLSYADLVELSFYYEDEFNALARYDPWWSRYTSSELLGDNGDKQLKIKGK